jgi:predicted TIM-barrel fold metal-dependent hydrolase
MTAPSRNLSSSAMPSPRVRLIDCDSYLGRHPRRVDVGENGLEQMLHEMDRVGIDLAIVASHQARWHSVALGNDAVSSVAASCPRLRACWAMLPDSCGEVPPAAEFVAEARQRGVVAMRAYPADQGYDLLGRECERVLHEMTRAGMPLLIDAEQAPWSTISELARRFPQLPVVVCQVGYRTLRSAAAVMDVAPHVRCDVANLTSHGAIRWLTERFGPERLIFGSGAPVRDRGEAVAMLLLSEVSANDVAAIGAGNASALFGLRRECQ